MNIYLVGGAVRDKLLGLPVHERDWVVVGARPEDLLAQGYTPVGKDFPVFLHPETHEEYALARTERKTAPGYKGFVVHADPAVTLEEDLLRRDLTINAIAEAADGTLIDPCHGQDDLRDGRLKHVSPAFVEDPVRILRVARFAARLAPYGFHVAHATHKLMQQMVDNGEVDALVPERVWAELVRALDEPRPARFFEVLHSCGALARLMPALAQRLPATGAHAPQAKQSDDAPLAALSRAATQSAATALRFAVLVQGLASDAPDGDELAPLCERMKVPNDFRELASALSRVYTLARQLDMTQAENLFQCIESVDALRRPERFGQILDGCQILGLNPDSIARLRAGLSVCLAVSAEDIVKSGARGPEVGTRLRAERLAALAQSAQQQ